MNDFVKALILAALTIIIFTVCICYNAWKDGYGSSTYNARVAYLSSAALTRIGWPPQGTFGRFAESSKHSLQNLCKWLCRRKVDAQTERRARDIYNLHERAKQAGNLTQAKNNFKDAVKSLEKVSDLKFPVHPEKRVQHQLCSFQDELEHLMEEFKSGAKRDAIAQKILEISRPKGSWSWYKAFKDDCPNIPQPGHLWFPIQDLLDFIGRGTSVGLLTGLGIAQFQEDPLGTPVSVLPLVGALIGGVLNFSKIARKFYDKDTSATWLIVILITAALLLLSWMFFFFWPFPVI